MILRRLARTFQDARPGLRDAPLAFSLRGAPLGVESLTPKLTGPSLAARSWEKGGREGRIHGKVAKGWGPGRAQG